MTSKEIIDKLLEINELDFNKFAMECGIVPNTLTVAIDRDKLSDSIVTKIHDRFKVRKEFLKTGKGEIFNKKLTDVEKPYTGVEINTNQIYKDLVEANTEYRLVPKSILDEEYRIIPKSEIEEKAQMWRETLAAKNALIDQLHKEIAELGKRSAVHSKHT